MTHNICKLLKNAIYICLLINFITTPCTAGNINKCIDTDGKQTFSDKECPNTSSKRKIKTDPPNKPRAALSPRDIHAKLSGIIVKLRGLLEQKKFEELNNILHSLQIEQEKEIRLEEVLFTAYEAFDLKHSQYEPLLNAWAKAYPEKYQPHLAKAKYYYGMGWLARGTKWASETKKENFKQMSKYFNKSLQNLSASMKLFDKSMVAYHLLIGLTSTKGMPIKAEIATKKALRIRPASYHIRQRYLYSLIPRWGGSYEKMNSFAEESIRYAPHNPKLGLLPGYIFNDVGDMYAIARQHSKAKKSYDDALAFGENHAILYNRAETYFRLNNYKDALADLNRAIEMNPEIARYYYWRSKVYGKIEQYNTAAKDIISASNIDPHDDYINSHKKWLATKLVRLGYELDKTQQLESAIDKYNIGLRLDPEEGDHYYWRARTYVNLNDHDRALADLYKAIKLKKKNISYYLLVDYILAKRKQWDQIIKHWDTFIANNPKVSRAYVERGGAYFHKGDIKSAVKNAKIAADMGNLEGKEAYEKFKHLVH